MPRIVVDYKNGHSEVYRNAGFLSQHDGDLFLYPEEYDAKNMDISTAPWFDYIPKEHVMKVRIRNKDVEPDKGGPDPEDVIPR